MRRIFPVKVQIKSPTVVRVVQIREVEKLANAVNSSAATIRKARISGSIDQGEDDRGAKSHTRKGNLNPRCYDQLCLGNLQQVSISKQEGVVESRPSMNSQIVDIPKVD